LVSGGGILYLAPRITTARASMSGLRCSEPQITNLDIRPLAGRIGAQIDNIRLTGDLSDAILAAIEAALSKYKVIFFRSQGQLDDGETGVHPSQIICLAARPVSAARFGSGSHGEAEQSTLPAP
jgi:alpha-ketoglutarate-dependent sulfate ester dioxygenase